MSGSGKGPAERGPAPSSPDEGAPAPGAQAEEELTLEGRLGRLDRIVALLEADDVELDEALRLFEEGVRHVRAAEKALSEAELRVEELLGEGPDAETRPLHEEEE